MRHKNFSFYGGFQYLKGRLFALFLLGGDFWDKVRALFVRRARVTFPAD